MSNETQQATEGQAPAAQLQLSDLLIAAQVIQLASARGAIKPEEFSQVGGAYERIVAFLRESGAIKAAEPVEPTEAPAEAPAA